MSQHQIEPYEAARLVEAPDAQPQEAPAKGLPLLTALRRHWRLAVVVWLLLAIPSAPAVLLMIKPTFTASAQVEVAPIVPAILYQDEAARQAPPLSDAYLNTQAESMASLQVLNAALADPNVRDLPLARQPEAAAALRSCLTVRTVAHTYLVQVSVTQKEPDAALRLTKAILDAYMARAVGLTADSERNRRSVLEKKREELRARLEQQSGEIRKLAETYGTSSESTFDILREGMEQYTLETKQELERAELEVLQLEQQLKQLQEGKIPETVTAEEAQRREELIAADGGIRWLREQLDTASSRLVRLRSALPKDHKDVVAAEQKVKALQAEMEREWQRAATTADRELAARRQDQSKVNSARMSDSLILAKHRRDLLKQRVERQNQEGLRIGRQGLEIQSLEEQKQATKAEYDLVTEALKQIDLESRRPARITVASQPEIRPEGVNDRRLKMAAVAVVGSLMMGIAVALLRNQLDTHLQDTEQVEAGMGLHVLGAVPSIRELQAGTVSRDDFRESYRCIRTTLAGGNQGSLPRSILITSAQSGEGKTSLAVSLAASLAEPGLRVLLIDGDSQAPQIAKLLHLPPRSDVSAVLSGEIPLCDAIRCSKIPRLDVLTANGESAGARHVVNLVSVDRLVREAVAQYDHVVIDSPPALGAADALVWAHVVDGVIVSSVIGHSDIKAIRLACQRLQSVGAKLLGAVIANVSIAASAFSYSSTSCAGRRKTPAIVHLPDETTSSGT